MGEFRERIANTALRFSGRPVTLSPLLDEFGNYPDFTKRASGKETKFRLIVFTGYIDPEDVEITFPKPSVLKVHIKHDPKAVDQLAKRGRLMTPLLRRHGARLYPKRDSLVFSRDCSTYYTLPEGVTKYLSAQWTWDGFIIIEANKMGPVTEFDPKRLIPVMNSQHLDPCLNLNDLAIKVDSVLEASNKLWEKIEEIAPKNDYEIVIRRSEMEDRLEELLAEGTPEENSDDEYEYYYSAYSPVQDINADAEYEQNPPADPPMQEGDAEDEQNPPVDTPVQEGNADAEDEQNPPADPPVQEGNADAENEQNPPADPPVQEGNADAENEQNPPA